MSVIKRHSAHPTFEELSKAYAVAYEYTRSKTPVFYFAAPKKASIPDHFHLICCDDKFTEEDKSELMTNPHIECPIHILPKVLVGIPAYNEQATIGNVVRKTGWALADMKADGIISKDFLLLVMDDGSEDETKKTAVEHGAFVLGCGDGESHYGYGKALSEIFNYAKVGNYDILIILDADGQHNPQEIPNFLEALKEADVVIGNRFMGNNGTPLARKIGIELLNMATGKPSGADCQYGFRAYNRKAIETINITNIGMSASLEILAQANEKGLKIKDIPSTVTYYNKPKRNFLRQGLGLIEWVLWSTIYKSPLLYLGLPAFLFTIIGLASASMVLLEYLRVQWFPIQWAIISAIGFLLGLQLMMTGLVIWIVKKSKGTG